MLKKISLLILLFAFLLGSAQSRLAIPLNTVQKNARLTTFTAVWGSGDDNYDPSVVYKGIPSAISSYIIKTLDFQPPQGMYELYLRLQGEMPKEALAQGLKYCGFQLQDTIILSREPIRHFVSFLVGKNKKDQLVIIGDLNNNFDFSDDSAIRYDLERKTPESGEAKSSKFYFQYAYEGKVVNDSVYLTMSPKSSTFRYINPIEQELFLTVSLNEYKTGLLQTRDTLFHLKAVFSKFPEALYNKTNTRIFLGEDEWDQHYFFGDSIFLGSKKYLIDDIAASGDTLYLSVLKNEERFHGVYPGAYADIIVSTDFLTNVPFDMGKSNGKFVLLDFWGSWCGPCIEAIPDLVKFSGKYSDRLQIVSIAEDTEDRKDVLKAMIRNKDMKWIHLFEKLNDTSSKTFANRYKVDSYPTQILINPEGKIIYRSTLESKLTEEKLNSLLRQ
jgi:thiol-disulfide isomerase/thioredoxin